MRLNTLVCADMWNIGHGYRIYRSGGIYGSKYCHI